jgi:hypothetical protein
VALITANLPWFLTLLGKWSVDINTTRPIVSLGMISAGFSDRFRYLAGRLGLGFGGGGEELTRLETSTYAKITYPCLKFMFEPTIREFE